jgi:neutral ceramidase
VPAKLLVGSASVDITPTDSQFLFGYPHVPRHSTGVHDPLLASALYLNDGHTAVLFVANDVIGVSNAAVRRARQRISAATGVPAANIMITATHTHSGPCTVKYLSNEADSVVTDPDPRYVQRLEDGIVAAAEAASKAGRPAQLGLGIADGSAVGGNRRDPAGPANPRVAVLAARSALDGTPIAAMVVCNMHPTVLHEDSTLVSGDFPAMARQYLQRTVLHGCPVIWHTGPSGNQSPRHVTRGNTFAEAERLGETLGASIAATLKTIEYQDDVAFDCRQSAAELPLRELPAVAAAEAKLKQVKERLEQLRRDGAERATVRTAECDWFGAEETLVLARAAQSGKLQATAAEFLPAEIHAIRLGHWTMVGWPGEVFVEFGLRVRKEHPDTFVISLANGDTQGYLVTAEAVAEGGYEASNGLFRSPQSGELLVTETLNLLKNWSG